MQGISMLLSLGFCVLLAGCGQPATKNLAEPTSKIDKIDAAIRSEVINNLIKELNESYVFAETAKRMEIDLLERLKNKEYEAVTDAKTFAKKLTDDLQLISRDKHLHVDYSDQPLPISVEKGEPSLVEKDKRLLFDKHINFGFAKVERMDGNIGYIDLRGFHDPEFGKETVAAAMTFISNTEALIIDLRQNHGGAPAMVALITSYLFGDEPVHLSDIYWRKEDKTDEFWTNPNVAGKRIDKKDVYVLTSVNTFSGAEEFCYNLKHLKRATIIGQTTRGGAHPCFNQRLNEHFSASIPRGRSINPITKTNWEGTGVEPDVNVPEEQALETAYIMALTKLFKTVQEEGFKENIKRFIRRAEFELDLMQKKVPSAIKLPNTKAGIKMRAYLDAINAGKIENIFQFITENFAPNTLEKFSAKNRADACMRIHMKGQHLDPVRIEKSSENEIEIFAYAKEIRECLIISLELELKAPYRIIDEMIRHL